MKINYDEIITKANERKEQLQALTTKLQDAEAQAAKLAEALQYFWDLELARRDLDAEGQELLPRSLGWRISCIGSRADALRKELCDMGESYGSSLSGLIRTIEE